MHPDAEVEASGLLDALATETITARLLGGLGVAMHRHIEWPPQGDTPDARRCAQDARVARALVRNSRRGGRPGTWLT
jgi:hypothetical protein